MHTCDLEYRGEAVRLRLRRNEDPTISAWEKMAIDIIAVYAVPPYTVIGSELPLNSLMTILCRRETGPGIEDEDTVWPWRTWFDVDAEVLGEIVSTFVRDILAKVARRPSRFVPAAVHDALQRTLTALEVVA